MSSNWYLYSFDQNRWDSLFGGGNPEHAEALVAELTDEQNFDFEDPDAAAAVARKLVREGFTAGGFDEEEMEIVECIPSAIFRGTSELRSLVNGEPESPEGTTWQMLKELMKRAEGHVEPKMIRLLTNGRSLADSEYDNGEYVILSPNEVQSLHEELQQIVSLDVEWSDEEFPPYIQRELLEPIQSTATAGRALAVMIG